MLGLSLKDPVKSLEARVVAPRLLAADNLDEFFEVRREHDLCVIYTWGDGGDDDDDGDGDDLVATGDKIHARVWKSSVNAIFGDFHNIPVITIDGPNLCRVAVDIKVPSCGQVCLRRFFTDCTMGWGVPPPSNSGK